MEARLVKKDSGENNAICIPRVYDAVEYLRSERDSGSSGAAVNLADIYVRA